MVNGINSIFSSLPTFGVASKNQSNGIFDFDYNAAVKEATQKSQDLLNSLLKPSGAPVTAKSLKQESAAFLTAYTASMKTLDQSADKLRGGNLNKLLFDKDGAVTDATVKNTVDAVKDTVSKYNSTLKLLNDNADRGPGVMKQLARMAASDPASEYSMNKIGMSVNKDGTLELDEARLTAALKSDDPTMRKELTDIIGGHNGVADRIHVHTIYGSTMSSRQLIGNDIYKEQDLKNENPYYQLYQSIKGKAYALNDMAYAGLLLNTKV